jgi:hypothetical protein
MKVKTSINIFLHLHKSNRSPTEWQGKKISVLTFVSLIGLQPDDKVRKYLSTLSSWRPIRLMKVKTSIFLPCHLVGDLLDWWRSRQENICLDLHKYNTSPTKWQGKKISVLTFISLIGLQPDDKVGKYLSTFISLIGLQSDDKVRKSDIFLPCHLVGDLLDWWSSSQIFSYLVNWLETY